MRKWLGFIGGVGAGVVIEERDSQSSENAQDKHDEQWRARLSSFDASSGPIRQIFPSRLPHINVK